VSHDVLLVADHVHSGGAVTTTARGFPLEGMSKLVRPSWKVQLVACVTVNVWPAIDTLPLLALPAFGATFSRTVSLPLALSPRLTRIHDVLVVAVHVQLALVETVMSMRPPSTPIDSLDGLSE
jgi:hypothetical protein